MKTKSQPVIMARLSSRKTDQSDFDLKFWKKSGVTSRFSAAWEMVTNLYKINPKKYVRQSRLQRSVAVLKRRES